MPRPIQFLTALFIGMAFPIFCRAAPTITISSTPAYGTYGSITGVVSGVSFSSYQVAGYILVPGLGWFTKPTSGTPVVSINSDGTFFLYVTSGGLDPQATIFCASLIPTNDTPPLANGSGRVPVDTNSVAMAFVERYGPTVSFANRTWAVKDGPLPVGPGPNYFSTNASSVWVSNGLHVTISYTNTPDTGTNKIWTSTEVTLLDHLGYGTYLFKTVGRNDLLDGNAVFGMFTYDDYGDDTNLPAWPYRELDFEDSIWNTPGGPNTQYVVQPYDVSGNRHQYYLPTLATNSVLTRILTWSPGSTHFVTLLGDQPATNYLPGAVVQDYTLTNTPAVGNLIPQPGRERVHFNLYLFHPGSPTNGQPVAVTVSDFQFTPLPVQILSAQTNGHDLILNVTGAYGTNYQAQATTNLANGGWTNFGNTFVGTGGSLMITNTNALSLPQQYFRVKQGP